MKPEVDPLEKLHLLQDGYFLSVEGSIDVPTFGNVDVLMNDMPPSSEDQIRNFIIEFSSKADLLTAIYDSVFEEYDSVYKSCVSSEVEAEKLGFETIKERSEMRQRLSNPVVYLTGEDFSTNSFTVHFDADWDMEHGVDVFFTDWQFVNCEVCL